MLNETLEKHGYWKAIRIVAWIARFLSNCKVKGAKKKSGPLTTEETETQVERWIYRVQSRFARNGQVSERRASSQPTKE